MARIGTTECAEARSVLHQERLLLPPQSAASVYEEFAARYLELRYFARDRLATYFPALTDPVAIDLVLREDVNADLLFAATRPDGAAAPMQAAPPQREDRAAPAEPVLPPARVTEESMRKLLGEADRAAACGNRVRAAVLPEPTARH